VEVRLTTVDPTPTAVVAAITTWTEFPFVWGPMLDLVWSSCGTHRRVFARTVTT
jgi:hypothetical protein